MEQFIKDPSWNSEQLDILNSAPNRIITGIAGSGKTLVACHLAIKYAKLTNVLFLVYTKSLCSFVKKYLESYDAKNITVEYEYQWRKKDYDPFGLIIIDEYQDFSSNDIQYAISRAKDGIYIFGDDKQRVYRHNFKKEPTILLEELQGLTNYPKSELTCQFRVSAENGAMIKSLFDLDITKDSTFTRKKPAIYSFSEIESEVKFLVDFLKKTKYQNVGILLKQNEDSSGEAYGSDNHESISYPGINSLHEILKKNDIEHGYKFRFDDHLIFNKEKQINIMTYHSAKGLLFDCVILPFSSLITTFINNEPIFVALTRATSQIIVTYTNTIAFEYFKMYRSDCYDGTLKILEGKHFLKAISEINMKLFGFK